MMNCEQFLDRLNETLDGRSSPLADEALIAHAEECPHCAQTLSTWSEIDLTLRTQELHNESSGRTTSRLILAMAAVLVASATLAIGWATNQPPTPVASVNQTEVRQPMTVVDPVDGEPSRVTSVSETVAVNTFGEEPDSSRWWQSVSREDWVAGAMPTVQWVEDGVVPIGRSMRRAFAILLVPAGNADGESSAIGNPIEAGELDAFREQTSSAVLQQRIFA
ncbi:MAG: hypothetical protein AAF802_05990 [Planctomycetota bacterium]